MMASFFSSWVAVPLMAFEFLAFAFLYSLGLEKREYYLLRFLSLGVLEIAAIIVGEALFSIATGSTFYYGQQSDWNIQQTIFKFFFFLLIYLATLGVLAATLKQKVSAVFLVSAASFATQHLTYNAALLFGLSFAAIPAKDIADGFGIALRVLLMAIAGFLVGFINMRSKAKARPYEGNTKKKMVASAIVVFVCIGIFRLYSDMPTQSIVATIGFSLYAIVSCSLLLLLFFGLWESDRTHAEAEAYREMLHQQKEQYELSKRNIDLISMKCHDLKHQIQALKTRENDSYVKELEHEIMIYDAAVKTGNEVLDVILREKMLQCEAEGITMTCFVDGKAISFMEEMDVYSLFGNLLSNAFESAAQLKEKQKRTISISARTVGAMLFLHEENYHNRSIEFENGLPKTTKSERDLHGFGLKSMKRTAEKYGGEMVVKVEGDRFCIDFVFPVPQKV